MSQPEVCEANCEQAPLTHIRQERVAASNRRQLLIIALVAAFSALVSILGLKEFLSTDFVQSGSPATGGPKRGYEWSALVGISVWTITGPAAVAAGMKFALVAAKLPTRTEGLYRYSTATAMLIVGVATIFAGAFWLKAQEMLSCGYLWCYAANESKEDPSGFYANVGSEVFFTGLGISATGLALFCQRGASQHDAETDSFQARMRRMKRAIRLKRFRYYCSVAVLLLSLPVMLLLTGLLPNSWERFSRNTATGKVHSLKYFMAATGGIDGIMQSEKPGAWMVTQNWHWSDAVVVKFFPDTVLFYCFLEGIIIVSAISHQLKPVRKILQYKLREITISHLMLTIWFLLFLFLFIWYWAHDHYYHGDGKYDKYALETPARVAGVVAIMTMGLLLLPASKSSPFLAAVGISWESALWVHLSLGVLFLLSASLHVIIYFARFAELGYAADILPLNALFWYPQNPVGGKTPSDNWAVPLMSTVFWPALVFFGIFPWLRRKHWELFRFSHNWFMVLYPTALWHATHAWYFVLPGMTLWLLDRVFRFLNSTEVITVREFKAHTVDCWTDDRPGCPSRNVPEKITKVAFTWPGERRIHSPGMYALVNFPEISLAEWHPFSLSSSPLDPVTTMHIKNMGNGTFSGQLHELANSTRHHQDVVLNIQGPYGPYINLHIVPRVLLVAGGIGVTPMVNALRCAVQRAQTGDHGALKYVHFVWTARSADVFGVFEHELSELLVQRDQLPIEVAISLFCSTKLDAETRPVFGDAICQGQPQFHEILAKEVAQDRCLVRACGPPPMVKACKDASCSFGALIDFEPWSFVL